MKRGKGSRPRRGDGDGEERQRGGGGKNETRISEEKRMLSDEIIDFEIRTIAVDREEGRKRGREKDEKEDGWERG